MMMMMINKIMDPSSHGLYHDDGLIIVDNSRPKKCDGIRKNCISCLRTLDLG